MGGRRTKGGFGTLEYSVSCGMATQVFTQWPAGMATARPERVTSGYVRHMIDERRMDALSTQEM